MRPTAFRSPARRAPRSASAFGLPYSLRMSGLALAALALAALALAACGDIAATEEGVFTRWGDDLLAAGSALPTITDSIAGDAIVAGPEISFSGVTGGDYLGAGGRQQVAGDIGGNLRAAGGDLEVSARVGRNATLAGGRVDLGPDARLEGNAYLAGGLVRVAGDVEGHLRVAGDEVLVDGTVAGDMSVDARSLRLGPAARVGGNLTYRMAPDAVEIDPGAQVAGEVVALPPREAPRWAMLPFEYGWWAVRIIWALGFLLAGVVLAALLPGTFLRSSGALEQRPGASAGVGLLWLVGVPLVVGIAGITVVGLPLALVLLGTFMVFLYVARIVPAIWLGRRILKAEGPGRSGAVVAFLLGGFILVLLGLIPFLGWLVGLLATLFGVGALLLALARTEGAGSLGYRPDEEPGMGTPPPAPPAM
jgi:hypothetical protein